MRKLSLFVGLTLFAMAGTVRAQDEAPAAAPADPAAAPADTAAAAPAPEAATAASAAASESKMQVGVHFLPMVMGKLTYKESSNSDSGDLAFAYGVGLSFGYNIIAGLSVGIAPQILLNVKPADVAASKEYDILARIAYAYRVIPQLAIYAEVLPGYSIISYEMSTFTADGPAKAPKPKGFVIAGGIGAAYDITDLIFVNLGFGYQMGFQGMAVPSDMVGKPPVDNDYKTKFLRIAVGGGVKF